MTAYRFWNPAIWFSVGVRRKPTGWLSWVVTPLAVALAVYVIAAATVLIIAPWELTAIFLSFPPGGVIRERRHHLDRVPASLQKLAQGDVVRRNPGEFRSVVNSPDDDSHATPAYWHGSAPRTAQD